MNRFLLVIPAHNEAAHLPAVLASIAAQRIERERMRVIVVDDSSSDATGAVALAWLAAEGIEGEVLRVDVRAIPRALNAGIARACPDEFVVRLDAHTTYDPDYLAQIDAAFERLGDTAWVVGGAQIPARAESFAHEVVVSLMTSRMGLGGAPFRTAREPMPTTSVYLGAFRPGVLQRVGGYNEAWLANEDAELAARVTGAGGAIWWIPLESAYRINRGPFESLAQLARYGYWRGRTLRVHPHLVRPRHLAPPLALLAATALVGLGAYRTLAIGAIAYAAAVVWSRPNGERPITTLATLAFFPAAHATFALGLLRGLLVAGQSPPPPGPERRPGAES